MSAMSAVSAVTDIVDDVVSIDTHYGSIINNMPSTSYLQVETFYNK